MPIINPFPNITMHIKKAPGVGCILPHINGLIGIISRGTITIPVIIGMGGIDIIPPGIKRSRTCPTGIFPLSFGGKYILPSRG
jgi:hypothetical protein